MFNRQGFNAVSIDDVMAEAELTRGSFYCYFASKSDLYAQSVARVVHEDKDNQKDSTSERSRADKIVCDYLSAGEHEDTGDTFPMIGLPNDISRTDRAVRQAFESAFKLMIRSLSRPRVAAVRLGGIMRWRSLRSVWAAWFYLGRSTIASWRMSCAAPR